VTLLVAPDSFKGTLNASQVADAIAAGIEVAGGRADRCPVADGGEGTMSVLLGALGGVTSAVVVSDPLGRPVTARLGLTGGGATAIVEVAQASGYALLAEHERDAEAATTVGSGELIAEAVRRGARTILVALGGSATTDGGAGAIDAIERAGGLRGARLVLLCDVQTPFEDAPALFGPQKGADPAAVQRLEARLAARAAALPRDPRGVAMTGAAGGLAGGLWATYDAQLRAGAPFVLDAVSFDERLAACDAVVSGEGRVDAQTLDGKIVGEIADRARRAGRALFLVVGSCAVDAAQLDALGAAVVLEATDESALRAAGAALAGRDS
jgi:glycerate kinase